MKFTGLIDIISELYHKEIRAIRDEWTLQTTQWSVYDIYRKDIKFYWTWNGPINIGLMMNNPALM